MSEKHNANADIIFPALVDPFSAHACAHGDFRSPLAIQFDSRTFLNFSIRKFLHDDLYGPRVCRRYCNNDRWKNWCTLWSDHTKNLDFVKATEIFLKRIEEVLDIVEIVNEKQFFHSHKFNRYVFEGSQGILLDQTHGLFYPHVTMANTTSKNALEIIERNSLPKPEIFYVTRCYQTRHGNGWMSNESLPIKLKNNEKETNILNEYQGNFRTGVLDVDMIKHAIMVDNNFSYEFVKNISITCLDQVDDEKNIPYTIHGEFKEGSVENILEEINEEFNTVLKSYSDKPSEIKKESKYLDLYPEIELLQK